MTTEQRIGRLVCVIAIVCALFALVALSRALEETAPPPLTQENGNGASKQSAEHTTIPAGKASRPFEVGDKHDDSVPFIDKKGKARLETCIGPCLKKYPGLLKFVMSESTKFSGLQVMFISEKPSLKFYNEAEELTEQMDDIGSKSSAEIQKILVDHGVEKFTDD